MFNVSKDSLLAAEILDVICFLNAVSNCSLLEPTSKNYLSVDFLLIDADGKLFLLDACWPFGVDADDLKSAYW